VTSQFTIWMETDPDAPWYWTAPKGTSADTSGRAASLEEKAALAQLEPKDICVIIAGQSVRILAHDLPKLNNKERLSAARFAIEDDIAGTLSKQHIVLGSKDDARIAIISQAKMQEIIDALDKAGLKDAAIYADFDILSSANENFALETRVICARPLGHTLDKAWHDPKEAVNLVQGPQDLAPFIITDTAINLRQNDFAPRQSFAFSGAKINFQSLGRLAALFVLCGITWLGFQSVSARAKGQETAYIKSETAKLYSKATGQTAPANPALAATRAVQAGPKQTVDFLTLSKVLFNATAQTDGIIIEAMQYDKSRAELSLRIIYPGFGSTTDLEAAALSLGGIFEAGGVREQGGEFIGDATLRMGGAQ